MVAPAPVMMFPPPVMMAPMILTPEQQMMMASNPAYAASIQMAQQQQMMAMQMQQQQMMHQQHHVAAPAPVYHPTPNPEPIHQAASQISGFSSGPAPVQSAPPVATVKPTPVGPVTYANAKEELAALWRFVAFRDASLIRRACKGLGTDDEMVIRIICQR